MSRQTSNESDFFNEDTRVPQASQEVEEWRNSQHYDPPFGIERWRVIDEVWNGKTAIDAVVVVDVDGRQDFGAAQGVGGVNALDQALRQVLTNHFPFIESVQLVELYTHRGGAGTAAEVVSIMKFSDGVQQWSTMRQSRDLLESAWLALIDGYEWAITMSRKTAQ